MDANLTPTEEVTRKEGDDRLIWQLTDFVVAEYLRSRHRMERAYAALDINPRAVIQEVHMMMEERVATFHLSSHRGIKDHFHDEAHRYVNADPAYQNMAKIWASEQITSNISTDEVTGALLLSASAETSDLMRQVFLALREEGTQWKVVLERYRAPLSRMLALKSDMTQRQSMERDRLLDVLISMCHKAAISDVDEIDHASIHDAFIQVYEDIAGENGMFFITEQPMARNTSRSPKELPAGQVEVTHRRAIL